LAALAALALPAILLAGCSSDGVSDADAAAAQTLAIESCNITETAPEQETPEGQVPVDALLAYAELHDRAADKAAEAAALDPQWQAMVDARRSLAEADRQLAELPVVIDDWTGEEKIKANNFGDQARDARAAINVECKKVRVTAPPTAGSVEPSA
jgi:hypothetical protein